MSTQEQQESDNDESLLWAFQSILTMSNTSVVAGNRLAAAHSNHALIIDLSNGTETYKRMMGAAGDGVACICGHAVYAIFAYAESSTRSRVFIFEFPTFRKISILENVRKKFRRILCLTFSETEHLVLLTGNPDYEIEVWNWRTGKLLVAQTTGLISDMQYIRCSRSFPLTATQLAVNTGKIIFWEIFIAMETATLIKRIVRVPSDDTEGPFHFCYALDGSLYIANDIGFVWHAIPLSQRITEIITFDKNKVLPIDKSSEMTHHDASCLTISDSAVRPPKSLICLYKGGLVKTEPDGNVRFYKKSTSDWLLMWTITMEVPLIVIQCIAQEHVVGFDKFGNVVDLMDECDAAPSFRTIKQCHRCINHFVILNPLGEQLVVIDDFDRLLVLAVATAKQLAMLLTHNIGYMLAHPSYPIVALGSQCGIVHFVSVYETENPIFLTEFHLSSHRIVEMKFTPNGSTIVIFDESMHFFVIKGSFGAQWTVTHHVNVQEHVLSFTAMHSKELLIINSITVPVVGIKKLNTNAFVRMQLQNEGTFSKHCATLPNDYIFVYDLHENQPDLLIAVSLGSHSLDILRIDEAQGDDDLVVTVVQSVLTEHQFCYIQIQMGKEFFISWGLGGRVFVWDKESLEVLDKHTAQNYYNGGIRRAVTDPFRRFIVTLGNSGNIQCVKLNANAVDEDKFGRLESELASSKVKCLFQSHTIGFMPSGIDQGKAWVQIQEERQLEEERLLYVQNREEILADLQELKVKLKRLIDENEVAPDDEKLTIEAFNLDKDGAHSLSVFAQVERDTVQRTITTESAGLTKITDLIIASTWDLMEVKGKNVRGIFTRLKVENYALTYPDLSVTANLQRVIMWRASEQPVSKQDVFQPWMPTEYDQLARSLTHRPTFTSANDLLTRNVSDLSGVQGRIVGENAFSLSGTPSHEFITPLPLRYRQFEVISYHQMVAEIIMGLHDTLALRQFFNKIFDEMVSVKDNEMVLTRQRNSRLRHIQDELNVLEELKESSLRHDREIVDPEYAPDEIPESIVKVEANELSVTPYISPEEQRLLDEAVAEAERRRLEMLADDFRERALIKMMDGVLEIRWEDEIKKTPPAPDCISSGKDPKDYTPEDLLAIHEHEEEMKTLRSERERYRKMLVEEQAKIDQVMNDQVQKFNLRVGDTLMEKMRVEFAICCEDLKLLRNEQFNHQRLQFSKNEAKYHQNINDLRIEIDSLTVVLNVFEDALLNCKSRYEELSTKDRALDKQFKSSFAEFAGQAVVDQAYRVFRRRPKWQMRAWQTAAILQDMARRVNVADLTANGPPLPDECFAYLQLIEQVDKFSNAPNLMDQNLWQILCRMRRVKIEIEFKVRSLGASMAEAEASVNAFVREINAKRSKVVHFEKKLEELVEERNNHLIDRSVQLCMKRGQVEIAVSGRTSDFANSVLLHETDVHDINAIIKKAGLKKLKTMENAAVFRRQIIFKEWEHKVLRMKIEEKKDAIRVIEKTKITKEVQMWLKWKTMGWKEDISEPALDREIEAARMSLESMCNDIIKKINDTDQMIAAKKRGNSRLDKKIQHLNLDISELNLSRDHFYEEREAQRKRDRMQMLVQRSRLVRQVQKQHSKILELSTMLELQRLRTFPTLNLNAISKIDY